MASTLARCSFAYHSKPCAFRRQVLARAVEKEEVKEGLDFNPTKNAGLGFTEEDSAGQSNIFAVEPKQYVASGAADSNSSATLVVGAVFGVVAAAILAVGVGANSANVSAADTVYEDAGKYQSLSYYAETLK